MKTTLAPLLLLGLAACGTTESGTDHDSHDASTHDHATSTTTSSTGDSTTHDHATEHAPTSTGHEHTTTTGTTTGDSSPVADYCECMLVNCHDQYHGAWGEEHPMSEINCTMAAEMLPTVGMPTMSGNSLECRLAHCELAVDDPALCEAAIGGAPCM